MLVKSLFGERAVQFGPNHLKPDAEYVFKLNARGDAVCEVGDKEHFKQLITITEGYEFYDPDEPVKAKRAKKEPPPVLEPRPEPTLDPADPLLPLEPTGN